MRHHTRTTLAQYISSLPLTASLHREIHAVDYGGRRRATAHFLENPEMCQVIFRRDQEV